MSSAVFCDLCGERIPPEKLARRGHAAAHNFCNRACADEWRRQHGVFSQLAHLSNAAQDAYKAQHGSRPGSERKAAAIAASNREKPRRRK